MSLKSLRREVRARIACAAMASVVALMGVCASADGAPGTRPQAGAQGGAVWTPLEKHVPDVVNAEAWIRPERGQALLLDINGIDALLRAASLEGTPDAKQPTRLLLPDPNGGYQEFRVLRSPVMEPGLAMKFPEITTIVGQGVTDPTATLRADVTMLGFHAQVLSAHGDWYIDPFSRNDRAHYTSYFKRDLKRTEAWTCGVHTDEHAAPAGVGADRGVTGPQFLSSGTQLRTYRAAVACTGEYAAFFGGTVAQAQSAIVTAVNRVTGVYEREVAARLVLVGNNTSIVFTNSATDPYTNGNGGTMLSQNQTTITNLIGSANYDIGHVFSTGGGGVAGLGVVCSSTNKSRGVTGQNSPTGDPFWIDFVAHEMGHQFGGNHTFNNSSVGSCTGNRNGSTAHEPGSGSTIMAYAGICGTENLQPNSDAYFHTISFNEIRNFMNAGGACGTLTNTGNTPPSVSSPGNFTIPRQTPFFLTATGSDADGDPLTYCWEERALGAATTLTTADNGTSPLTRSRNPSTSPTRFIPTMATILAGTIDNKEKLPSVARTTWNWRVTARDNRLNGGGVNEANSTLTVSGVAGPFVVTSPIGPTAWSVGSSQTVTWNVAGTTANGVNAANVRIEMSTDNGATWPITLASNVPNSGSATFVVPNNPVLSGRVRVVAIGNVFFAVNPGGFVTINGVAPPVVLNGTGVNLFTDASSNGNANGRIDPGETDIRLSVQISNAGSSSATGVTATLTTLTPTVNVLSDSASYPALPSGSGVGTNASAFVLSVDPSHACGVGISLSLAISSDQGVGTYNFTLPTGLNTGSGFACTPPAAVCPAITLSPSDSLNTCLGTTVVFEAGATGDPAPSFQWTRNGANLNDDSTYSGVNTPMLTISSAFAFTQGLYACRVENSCGMAETAPATLSFCVADFNCVDGISVQDIFDFLGSWFAGSERANVNPGSGLGTQDIFDFLNAWFAGCP